MRKLLKLICLCGFFFHSNLLQAAATGKYFDRVIFVLFENADYDQAIKQPFFKKLAHDGANLSDMHAEIGFSQGNYIALTSGSVNGVKNDKNVNLDVNNIADLLERKNLTWKVYAEDYPGHCFQGGSSHQYARKHNPFISYINIQKNPVRCANIVDEKQFDRDIAAQNLPHYSFYVPNETNDGHDTGVASADRWFEKKFSPLLYDAASMKNTVIIATFDEGTASHHQHIYTSISGPEVKAGVVPSNTLNHYSLLRLIEDNWDLGDLGKNDQTAPVIPDIWK
jgi:hypothetical protein